ncbi:MAG TPA: hypothetical protein VHY08_13980 [Bacillota bacterium]|nr:hypothetical protein [Bacillota bacterium]
MKRVIFPLSIFLSLLLLFGCGNNNTSQVNSNNKPITFASGNNIPVTSTMIEVTGGTIEIGNLGTPIDGVKVEFPAGALPADSNVSVGYDTGLLAPNAGSYSGALLNLDVQNTKDFDQPVSITAPLPDADKIPVPYYVDNNGKLHPVQLIEVDRTNMTFTFQTFHASWYTWIYDTIKYALTSQVKTAYSPQTDGFNVPNNGSDYNRGGECFGMTSFSLWYFTNKKAASGSFYPNKRKFL